jgi:NAD-dependent deacetylase
MKRKIVIFTGAGISQESGIRTFRDVVDGYWEEFKVSEVATPTALKNNTQVFCDFYNMRKNQMKTVQPNQAHIICKELEEFYDVTIVTQNVDDLHEKAGSSKIFHLHGTLTELRSSFNPAYVVDYVDDLKPGDVCPDGAQMRPNIVLFHENLPNDEFQGAMEAIQEADVLVIVGTSMQVYPAAGMPWESKETCLIYFVDPNEMGFVVPKQKRPFFTHVQEKANDGMEFIKSYLADIFL